MTDESTTGAPAITVLGIGNILLTDEGFGVRVVEKLYSEYEFPDNVTLVDGGVLGINLLGVIADTQHLDRGGCRQKQTAPRHPVSFGKE
jgi:hypothetical protein